MKRTVLTDLEVLKLVDAKYTPLLVDFGDARSADIVTRYQIRGTPVMLVANAEGVFMRYVDGGVGKQEFLKFLNQ